MLRQIARQLCKNVKKNVLTSRHVCTTHRLLNEKEVAAAPAKQQLNILVEKDKNITLIGINRPQKRNAIDSQTAKQLCEAFSQFEADATSPVAVLYGIGGSFCAGFDIFEMGTDGTEEISVDILMTHEGSVGPTRRHISKPVVCGINGYCVANGLELALMCDLRVMEENAILGFFNRRFGVPVIDGGTARLPAMIGFSRALDLILTGRPVSATEAYNIGIANRVVPTGSALCNAIELANTLAKFPQGALNHDRRSLYSSVFEAGNFNQAVQNEVMYTSKEMIVEMQEGIKWFNKTFRADTTDSWFKRDNSMADWDDVEVAQAAAKVEEAKKAHEVERIEAEQRQKDEAEQKKKAKKNPEKKTKDEKETPPTK